MPYIDYDSGQLVIAPIFKYQLSAVGLIYSKLHNNIIEPRSFLRFSDNIDELSFVEQAYKVSFAITSSVDKSTLIFNCIIGGTSYLEV